MSEPSHHSISPSPSTALRREMRGFACAGALGFATDAALTLLLSLTGLLPPVIARIPATLVAIGVTFAFNRILTFRSRDPHPGTEFLRYLGVSLGGALINYLGYALFLLGGAYTGLLNANSSLAIFAAVAAGSALALVFNFIGVRYFAFTKRASAG